MGSLIEKYNQRFFFVITYLSSAKLGKWYFSRSRSRGEWRKERQGEKDAISAGFVKNRSSVFSFSNFAYLT